MLETGGGEHAQRYTEFSLAREGREDGVGHGRREREGARSRIEVSMEASRAGEQGGGQFLCEGIVF